MKGVFLCLLLCVSAVGVWAQSVAGSGVVSGLVLESVGMGMPDADVVVESQAMGVRRAVQTSMDGVFEAAGLNPGTGYRLRVTHQRFRGWESEEFEVPAGKRLSFEITLLPQDSAEAKEADSAQPPIDRTTSPIGIAVSERRMDMLPTANRRWDSLILLSPAVAASLPLGTPAIRGDASSNAYFTDGLLTSNGYVGGRSAPAGRVAQDAVEGFEVLAGGAPAEFAHSMGGAVNAVTRSGGNGIHGGVYEYYSNQSLNAIDRYAMGHNLFGRSNQTGFNLGGKIPQSKLFFFSNLEVSGAHGQRLNRITNPLIADSTGTRVAPSNCMATAAQCATAIRFIESQMNVLVPRSERDVTGLAKIDYRRSDSNTLSLAAYGTHSRSPLGSEGGAVAPNGGLLGNGISNQDTRYGKLEWISLPASTASNELRVGLFQDRISSTASNSGLSTGNVSVSLAGTTLAETHPDPGTIRERRLQLVDNLRASYGAHTFTVGVDWTRTRDWIDMLPNASGTYLYSSLTAFAQDLSGAGQKNYTQFTQAFGDSARNLATSEFGFYAQDSWKATPRLWATGGIRWSKPYFPPPTASSSSDYTTGDLTSPNINADPRVGLSYMFDERTVARASFGMFHAPHTGELVDAILQGTTANQWSIQASPTQTGAPLFPALVSAESIPTGTLNLMYATGKLRNPYTKQSTVALERYLGAGVTLTASYIGSRGVKLWTAEDQNLATPTTTATYTMADASGQKVGAFSTLVWTARNSTDSAHAYQVTNGGSSWYRALVLQLHKRMGHGFSAQASYTWSHAIDDAGGARVSGSIPWNSYNADHRADLGSSATDQRHRAVVDWLWQPKAVKSDSKAARYLLNGWEISSIVTLASSQPATALVVVNGQQFSSLTMAFPGSMNGSGSWSRVPFLPVNHLNADPEYTLNTRLARPIPFSERITGRLIFEAFNLFNTQFNTSVNTLAYTATGGVLTPVSGLGAGNAAQGYVNGTNARSCRVAFRLTF